MSNPLTELRQIIETMKPENYYAYERLKDWYERYVQRVYSSYSVSMDANDKVPFSYVRQNIARALTEEVVKFTELEANKSHPFMTVYTMSAYLIIDKTKLVKGE